MLHRPTVSAATLLAVLGILLTGSPAAAAPAGDLDLRFADLETQLRATSPVARMIDQEYAAAQAERDAALLWSNPALAYDHEEGRDAREWQLTLAKRFEQPFRQSARREAWAGRVRAAEFRRYRDFIDHLADLKAGYVRIRLAEAYLDRLDHLSEVVDLAAGIADHRHAEGSLSGVDRQLIRVAVYAVDAAGRNVRRDRALQAAAWRAELGLPAEARVNLTTPVTFQPVDLAVSTADLGDRPANQAGLALAAALDKQAEAARPSAVPGLDVFGGYKRFEDHTDGFVVGAAVDLPLFGHDAGATRRFAAESHLVDSARQLELARARGETASLVAAVSEARDALADIATRFEGETPLADTLLFAYREGSITLDALLGGLQIEAAALESYFDELSGYYDNIFRLEALTGATLISFAE